MQREEWNDGGMSGLMERGEWATGTLIHWAKFHCESCYFISSALESPAWRGSDRLNVPREARRMWYRLVQVKISWVYSYEVRIESCVPRYVGIVPARPLSHDHY
ncbi:hypothetical protein EVAR_79240_1 [Eumeta japonica]|uniref:Uncharacterized protein n=1 Tax=Eumeta variegata TaxID=151549 RepID=A0A4C1Z8C0_EUMVA|nr:hypothetical protein EVAR_79240_1 [Eumeta japonica]